MAYTYAHNYKKHKHTQLDKAQAHTYFIFYFPPLLLAPRVIKLSDLKNEPLIR